MGFHEKVNRTGHFAMKTQCFRKAMFGFQNVKYSIRFTMVHRYRESGSERIVDPNQNNLAG